MALAGSFLPGQHPDGFWIYPSIQRYGPVHLWSQDVLRPSKRKTYKVYFDVTKPVKLPNGINKPLWGVARLMNGFGSAGVPKGHLKFVVVVHSKATYAVARNKAHKAKFHKDNPNLPLLGALRKAGVKIYVWGNALADHDLTPKDVAPGIKPVVGALVTSTMFQMKGYALMRF